MVTSKLLFDFFFHGSSLLKSKDFLQCLIILMSSFGIVMCSFANDIALSKVSSVIDG